MNTDNIEIFPDIPSMAHRLAEFLQPASARRFSLVLSGGNTPRKIYQELAKNQSSIPWRNIQLFWGDERCVPPDHRESNFNLAKRYLFDRIQPFEGQIYRIKGENPPDIEKERYTKEILQHVEQNDSFPVFDLILLGLGDDGHVASLFPDQMHLLSSEKICEVAIHPISGQKRITLTGPVINQAKNILLLVTGKKKSSILSKIILNKNNCSEYPACFIKPREGNLVWFLDRGASSFL